MGEFTGHSRMLSFVLAGLDFAIPCSCSVRAEGWGWKGRIMMLTLGEETFRVYLNCFSTFLNNFTALVHIIKCYTRAAVKPSQTLL